MGLFLHLVRRLRARFRRDRLDDQLAEEIRLHLELRTQALVNEGVSPVDAAREAHRAFGNTAAIREQARDLWGLGWADAWLQDVRYAARQLWRTPVFSSVAVLSLAIGIGAAAAVFTVADAVLFRELAVRDAQRLRSLRAEVRAGGGSKSFSGVSDEALAAIRRDSAFADIIGFRASDAVLVAGTDGGPRMLRAEFVSDNYFDVLEVAARAGRTLGLADAAHADTPVVVSERTWKAAFGGDAAVAGRRLTLNGVPAVVVGVARGFGGLVVDRPADIFVPLASGIAIDRGLAETQIRVVTKLKPGVSIESAEHQLTALLTRSGVPMLTGGELHLSLIDARRGISDSRAPLSRPLWLGLALVGVLLLVAGANTGGLFVARFATRQQEFGVRIAIGAGRARLVRQLTVEALIIATLAAFVSLGVAWIAAPVLLQSVPIGTLPPRFDLRFDWRLAAFTTAISSVGALMAAAAAAWRVLRTNPSTLLAAGSRTVVPGRRTLIKGLIAAQVACSLLLLTAAGSMARTLINLARVDPGFDPNQTFTVNVDASHRRLDQSAAHDYYARLQSRIAALPPVNRVSLVQIGLMTGAATSGTADVTGFVASTDEDRWVRMFFVGSDFFETTGMKVIAGESLQARHLSARERVAVVNEPFARFYFGTLDRAIGGLVNRDIRIIGVVAAAHYDTLRDAAVRAMFVPFTQAPPRRQMTFVVRTGDSAGPASSMDAVTATIRAFDPQMTFTVTTGADRLASTTVRERFTAFLAATLSLLAVFLSCLGLYAAMAYAVSERRQELAVRLALGATGRDIVGQVVGDSLRTTALGISIGLPCIYALMPGLSSLLFGVAPFDVPTVLSAAALLLGVGALAGVPVARRAASIEPQEALHCR